MQRLAALLLLGAAALAAGPAPAITLADCCRRGTWDTNNVCKSAVVTPCDTSSATNDFCQPKCPSAPMPIGTAWCKQGPQACAGVSSSGVSAGSGLARATKWVLPDASTTSKPEAKPQDAPVQP